MSPVSAFSRETRLLSFLKNLSNNESELRGLLRNRFEADFIRLDLHKPEGMQPASILGRMLDTVTFYLNKQNRADARELALRIIEMPISVLVLTDTPVERTEDQDLQLTLKKMNFCLYRIVHPRIVNFVAQCLRQLFVKPK